jgi:hypothetical protein
MLAWVRGETSHSGGMPSRRDHLISCGPSRMNRASSLLRFLCAIPRFGMRSLASRLPLNSLSLSPCLRNDRPLFTSHLCVIKKVFIKTKSASPEFPAQWESLLYTAFVLRMLNDISRDPTGFILCHLYRALGVRRGIRGGWGGYMLA